MTTRRAKALNAYELLARVCEAIKAHPLAYYQGSWVVPTERLVQAVGEYTDAQMRTSCGTAYCRAGWVVALHDGRQRAVDLSLTDAKYPALPVADRSDDILGLDRSATHDLYDGEACDYAGRPGSRTYVRAGIRGLREFMTQHEAHLKAHSLRGV